MFTCALTAGTDIPLRQNKAAKSSTNFFFIDLSNLFDGTTEFGRVQSNKPDTDTDLRGPSKEERQRTKHYEKDNIINIGGCRTGSSGDHGIGGDNKDTGSRRKLNCSS
jgi:hypothetical protein